MAQTVQNVTLSLTLPITCHICLGKVRQPVICVNHHVFCTVCIELWLKNNNQCPVCRVPITAENPCKDIIGGTGENECALDHSVRKHLRKTRLELLHNEYEEEIESLLKEREELKQKNVTLEKERSPTTTVSLGHDCNCGTKQGTENTSSEQSTSEKWKKKLEETNAASRKLVADVEKLKEENTKLINENIDYVRENFRLKTEVDSRSPQKFGRFTVAALHAKIDQYEKEMNRLKKALERSDKYIEELEVQVDQLKRPADWKPNERSHNENPVRDKETVNSEIGDSSLNYEGVKLEQMDKIPEKAEKNQEDSNSTCPTANNHKFIVNKSEYLSRTGCSMDFQKDRKSFPSSSSATWKESLKSPHGKNSSRNKPRESNTPCKEKEIHEFSSPGTSLSFSSLQLNSPDCKFTLPSNQVNAKKPLTHLRKLVFDDSPKKRKPNGFSNANNNGGLSKPFNEPKSEYWACEVKHKHSRDKLKESYVQLESLKNKEGQILQALPSLSSEEGNRTTTTSESSMDITFLDVNKLDSMMSTLEGNENPHYHSVKSDAVMHSNSQPRNGLQALYSNPHSQCAGGLLSHESRSSDKSHNNDFHTSRSTSSLLTPFYATAQSYSSKNLMDLMAPEMTSNSGSTSYTDNKNGLTSKRKLFNPICDSPPKSFKP
ncbi:ORC ubiquitin ligase 1 L homeolog [Xenopus laevis]|uniref:LOC443579 protein n=1 Tax=Xenopus laevis TaxID=8355 RepID=Q52L28_XENLA|nr:ORC ubiquitin ligase 1 L homeolog [Xenopus laevis]AAH94092.1 LOC443579 protein [Xenopus laevis]